MEWQHKAWNEAQRMRLPQRGGGEGKRHKEEGEEDERRGGSARRSGGRGTLSRADRGEHQGCVQLRRDTVSKSRREVNQFHSVAGDNWDCSGLLCYRGNSYVGVSDDVVLVGSWGCPCSLWHAEASVWRGGLAGVGFSAASSQEVRERVVRGRPKSLRKGKRSRWALGGVGLRTRVRPLRQMWDENEGDVQGVRGEFLWSQLGGPGSDGPWSVGGGSGILLWRGGRSGFECVLVWENLQSGPAMVSCVALPAVRVKVCR
ncbi:hypothetical protein BV898_17320 [Hypsibius exemplaris]|uniref:Uncharacterized protein n=1 Tax=Hypsibius exemplaris TaxID=2072580 RepID=A0A9X6RLX2_HYPEX|nr:hypothetical protein BV898_17320 [Hypsibius exemplaris]